MTVLSTLLSALTEGVTWFPQDSAHEFYIAKGLLAMVTTVLVIYHMADTWSEVTTWGRRLRYFALLGYVSLSAFSSVEQVQEDALVSYRNLGVVLVLLLTDVAMIVSVREDRRRS